ncbi:hypothetical protein OEA41_007705 [Lepraria neglecta]|uniref:NAD(P)-binding protein n=1 Tax=Lepraria neglecta TaxID=209136 RepID=A0AAE0DNH7_9LECA|nr:hypothetical protein OEA41_007705 [Lepraria neglecta]
MLAQSKAKGISIADYNDKNFESVRPELQSTSHDIAVHTKKVDVASSSQVDAWIDEVVKQFGGIDGTVNAAGVTQRFGLRNKPNILGETNKMWDRTLGTNLAGVFYCTRAQVKGMMDLPREPRSIVNVASIASLMHGGDCFSYGVSKVGVAYLSTSVAQDVLSHNIRVNTVSHGVTKTPMISQSFGPDAAGQMDTQGFGLIQSEDVAKAIIWFLSSKSSQVAGVNLPVGPGTP